LSATTGEKQAAWLRILEIILGIIVIVIGGYVLAFPGVAILTLVFVLGIGLFVLGITRIFGAFAPGISGGMRVLSLIIGILAIILGIYVVAYPGVGAATLAFFLGFGLLLIGIESLAVGGTRGQGAGQGASVALGVIAIILGFVVLFWPGLALGTIALLLAVGLIILGLEAIVSGILGRWVGRG
jgi:uncharacterized membrane protein HdeD (DUF308 family)